MTADFVNRLYKLFLSFTGSKARTSARVKAARYGQMARCMKDGGKTTRPTEKADSSTLMAMSTMDSGWMIKPMATVFIAI